MNISEVVCIQSYPADSAVGPQGPVLITDPRHPLHREPPPDPINHPAHYRSGGLEAIQVIEAFGLGYALGNCVKYVLRAGRKDPSKTLEDLKKAAWYLEREIAGLEKQDGKQP